MQNLITIAPSDPRWPQEFRGLALALRAVLGDLAMRIDHIGSTAVPGLAAKDIIDIQIAVATLDTATLIPLLTSLGYVHLANITGDHIPPGRDDSAEQWRKLFFKAPPEQRRVNLHIRQAGHPNQRYALLFRDYLRADAGVKEAYAQIKQTLARLHPADLNAYYDVKDPVCDVIMAAAERWASETCYAPGPSDL